MVDIEEVMIDGKKRKAIRCSNCGNLIIFDVEEILDMEEQGSDTKIYT